MTVPNSFPVTGGRGQRREGTRPPGQVWGEGGFSEGLGRGPVGPGAGLCVASKSTLAIWDVSFLPDGLYFMLFHVIFEMSSRITPLTLSKCAVGEYSTVDPPHSRTRCLWIRLLADGYLWPPHPSRGTSVVTHRHVGGRENFESRVTCPWVSFGSQWGQGSFPWATWCRVFHVSGLFFGDFAV